MPGDATESFNKKCCIRYGPFTRNRCVRKSDAKVSSYDHADPREERKVEPASHLSRESNRLVRAQPQEARGVGVLEWVPLDAPGAPPAVPPEPPTRPQGRGRSARLLQVLGVALESLQGRRDLT